MPISNEFSNTGEGARVQVYLVVWRVTRGLACERSQFWLLKSFVCIEFLKSQQK